MTKQQILHEQIRPLLEQAGRISADNGINFVAAANVETGGMLQAAVLGDLHSIPLEMMMASTLMFDLSDKKDPHTRLDMLQKVAHVLMHFYRDELMLAKLTLRLGIESPTAQRIVEAYQAALEGPQDQASDVFTDEELTTLIDHLTKDLVAAMAVEQSDQPASA